MRVAVIDGQGGGIGKVLVGKIRHVFQETIEILALGTNSVATTIMVKAGANQGATGENAIKYNLNNVDFIVGTISILIANSMMGELTPDMASAIASSEAVKLLLPLNRSKVNVIGSLSEPLPHQAEMLVKQLHKFILERSESNV
ncbi:DUF3842 family protein [Desulfosporosinus sp. PR]|uniref:DUF3842 family protein n=1 Tax=Candidatus Desulfosporosinus nitrosoreducens TaxID=3401928 RepID=UPI0027EEA256|nr:DUF3842 family protein [Desulfosporosinus sp. PR]MDQ7093758.1 DUF3842 family protein [Desulfosporosinus sp. PR]